MERFEILIVGAGAAGIAAAKAAAKAGCKRILLVDCGEEPGGILRQCAHHGFDHGLNGPEYIRQLLADFPDTVQFSSRTAVLYVSAERTAELSGDRTVAFDQLIWAAGCREIPMGALPIAGTRPRGIYTAGQMQALVNLHGFRPEGPVVILGSGDIGLVMAKQLAEIGLSVSMVEKQPACGGLPRNRSCISEFDIPLHCSTTITEVFGHPELEAVALSDGRALPCRTLLIAVGLVPEQELIIPVAGADWLHLCGNSRTVHPMVETVVYEGTQAGLAACRNIRGAL